MLLKTYGKKSLLERQKQVILKRLKKRNGFIPINTTKLYSRDLKRQGVCE